MASFTVAVSDVRHASYAVEQSILEGIDAKIKFCDCVTEEDVIAQCQDADAIFLDLAPFTAKVAAALPKCKVVNRYGVGFENVDVDACTKSHIQVTNVPDYCMEDVSDHALALMMTCLRHVAMRDRKIRGGQWNLQAESFRLQGKTLGVIGAGRIARSLIRKVSGFNFKEILAYDPYVSQEELAAIGVRKVALDELLHNSDFVSVHLHVNQQTRGIIGADALSKMKPTAIFINVSRGSLVDDTAMVEALQQGRILCAGLDTHCQEPLGAQSPYHALDNVVLTDHTAYSTNEGVVELKTKSAQNIAAVLMGHRPAYPLN